MNRRNFTSSLLLAPGLWAQTVRYEPSWPSLEKHPVPTWFEDAKLGIFIHWGLYSVPAFAPPTGELGKVDWNTWFYKNPYAEWYLNTLRLKDTPTYEYHVKNYGADFDYYRFAETFNRETAKWRPTEWARLFKQTGARYVVLTTKHHDGFTLWPSKVANPKRSGLTVRRDLVGELTKAVRGEGMKMALYYSGGLDWTFEQKPIAQRPDLRATIPQSQEYASYADAHWRELIDNYRPSILWNDIGYPKLGKVTDLFAYYYNAVPEGLVNNRFSAPFADITTPEYAQYDKITEKKWESCRGLGFSFGYNKVEGPEHVIASGKLIEMVIDITSKNGNLLLNIGPKPDGSISDIQMDRLNALGAWLNVNGEGIFGTRPWNRPTDDIGGAKVHYTRKAGTLFVFVPGGVNGVTLPWEASPKSARILGGGSVKATASAGKLTLALPPGSEGGFHRCVALSL